MAPTIFHYLPEVLVRYLSSEGPQAMLDCPVSQQVPKDRPTKYVSMQSVPTSGSVTGLVLSSRRVIVQCDDATVALAGNLAETVSGLLVDAKYQGLGIKGVNVIGSPAHFPAPGQPNRHQLTADFTLRAKASVL